MTYNTTIRARFRKIAAHRVADAMEAESYCGMEKEKKCSRSRKFCFLLSILVTRAETGRNKGDTESD